MRELTVDGTKLYLRALPRWAPMDGLTLGRHVFVQERFWDTGEGEVILRHEAQHVRDQVRYHVLFFLSYLLPLPLGPLSLRGWWEWRAYRMTLRARWERDKALPAWLLSRVAAVLSGPLYLWAVPSALARRLVTAEAQRLVTGGSDASPSGGGPR